MQEAGLDKSESTLAMPRKKLLPLDNTYMKLLPGQISVWPFPWLCKNQGSLPVDCFSSLEIWLLQGSVLDCTVSLLSAGHG